MRWLFGLVLCCSCAGTGQPITGQQIEVPVTEAAMVASWVAEMPNYDRDPAGSPGHGTLNNVEFAEFLAFLSFRAYETWVLPPPTDE